MYATDRDIYFWMNYTSNPVTKEHKNVVKWIKYKITSPDVGFKIQPSNCSSVEQIVHSLRDENKQDMN